MNFQLGNNGNQGGFTLADLMSFGAPSQAPQAPSTGFFAQGGSSIPGALADPLTAAAGGGNGAGMAGGLGGLFKDAGGLEGIGSIADVIGNLGKAYAAMQGVGMARDQLDFSKKAFETNLGNQTKSYNTALEDRIRSRAHTEGKGQSKVDSYLSKHSL